MSSTTAEAGPSKQRGGRSLATLQKFSRGLMLPIATLPVAGFMLALGQDKMLGKDGANWPEVAAVVGGAGQAVFDHIPLLFAIGVAIAMARRADGSTALAAAVGWIIFKGVGDAMSPLIHLPVVDGEQQKIDYSALGGILCGLVAAKLWERFHRTKLPSALAFFNGRRLVPILTGFSTLVLSVLMSLVYKAFQNGLNSVGHFVAHNDVLGGFVYGTLNRLLIPTGLHHLLNFVPWFQIGSYQGSDGATVHGDIARFLAGDPHAGTFMTGFFPITIFALPAAALAIYHSAPRARRKLVGGLMGSAALCSMITGITEPLEFAFMFVAWPLYIVHAVLTGTSIALMNALGVRDGFFFSSGLMDYLVNFRIAHMPLVIIPVGLAYAVVYYVVFRVGITMFDLKTPGREEDESETVIEDAAAR